MTDEQYQQFIQAVKDIQASFAIGEVTDFTLTKKEAGIIEALPETITDHIDAILGSYKSDSALDIRGEVVAKFIAILVSKLSAIEKGAELGDEAGVLIVQAAGVKAS